jgi:chlorobactene glucosyltransferase
MQIEHRVADLGAAAVRQAYVAFEQAQLDAQDAARIARIFEYTVSVAQPAIEPDQQAAYERIWSGRAGWSFYRHRQPPAPSLIAVATSDGIDLLSLVPQQKLGSVAERLIMPCGLVLLAFVQDLRRTQSGGALDEVTASGQFLLVRRSAYEAIGGHAAVRAQICEDLELARLFKRSGFKVVLRAGERLLSARMYRGWRTLWPGLAKNLVDTLGGPARTIASALAAVVLSWSSLVIPAVNAHGCALGESGACLALPLAALGSMAAFALHIAAAGKFGIPLWYGLLFPIGYTAGALIAFDSVRRRWNGRVSWKGRSYRSLSAANKGHCRS